MIEFKKQPVSSFLLVFTMRFKIGKGVSRQVGQDAAMVTYTASSVSVCTSRPRRSFHSWKMTAERCRSSQGRDTANFMSMLQDNTGQQDNSHRPWHASRSLDGTEWDQCVSSFETLCAGACLSECPLPRNSNRMRWPLSRKKMRGTSTSLRGCVGRQPPQGKCPRAPPQTSPPSSRRSVLRRPTRGRAGVPAQ